MINQINYSKNKYRLTGISPAHFMSFFPVLRQGEKGQTATKCAWHLRADSQSDCRKPVENEVYTCTTLVARHTSLPFFLSHRIREE